MHSILSDTQAGQAAFFLLAEWHHIVDDGHAGGHFLNEWKALISRCEKIQVKSFRGMHIWMRKNSVQNAISGVLANPSQCATHQTLCAHRVASTRPVCIKHHAFSQHEVIWTGLSSCSKHCPRIGFSNSTAKSQLFFVGRQSKHC